MIAPKAKLLLLLLLKLAAQLARSACPAGSTLSTPDILSPGVALELAKEANLVGYDEPLGPGAFQDTTLADGASRSLDCHEVHWGLVGSVVASCSNGAIEVDTLGCIRAGCPWHRYSVAEFTGDAYMEPSRDLAVRGTSQGPPEKWAPAALGLDGALYAAPLSASSVLRVAVDGTGATQVTQVVPSMYIQGSFAKYSSAVLAPDGFIYCVPFSATQVMRIDTVLAAAGNRSAISAFGAAGTMSFKWSHGVALPDGRIFAVPAAHSSVLVIDTATLSIDMWEIDVSFGSVLQRFTHAVVSPQGDVYGIPGDAKVVLKVDTASGTMSTVGSFSNDNLKWTHGVLATDGKIYGIPGRATAVLRIDPSTEPPTVDTSLGEGLLDTTAAKWSQGVLASDGRIFCVPRAAQHVLVVDPAAGTAALIGSPLGGALRKWEAGVLAPDRSIYMIPADAQHVLRVTPDASGSDVVEEFGATTLPGERKYSGAVLTPTGGIYATPAYAAEILSIVPKAGLCLAGPLGQDTRCTLGLPCAIGLSARTDWPSALFSGSNGTVFVVHESALGCSNSQPLLEITGLQNPQPESNEVVGSSLENRSHYLGIGLAGDLSMNHRLCWAASPGSADILDLGLFMLVGPEQDHSTSCTLGFACEVELQGLGLDSQGWLLLASPNDHAVSSADHCSSINASVADFTGFGNPAPGINASVADFTGFSNPAPWQEGNEAGSSATFQFGVALQGLTGTYQLCWASVEPVGGNLSQFGSSTNASNASNDANLSDLASLPAVSRFLVHVGTIVINGPLLPSATGTAVTLSCWVGFSCELELSGIGLSQAQNLITLQESIDCSAGPGDSLPSMRGISNPATSTASGTKYMFGTPEEAYPKKLVLCWHAASAAAGIMYGTLDLYGPVSDGIDVQCSLNSPCNLSMESKFFLGSVGNGFGLENRLELVKASGCNGATAELWGDLVSPLVPEEVRDADDVPVLSFNLSTPLATELSDTKRIVGTYSLCLSIDGSGGPFAMHFGTLTVHDVQCSAPSGIEFSLDPACQSDDTGQAIGFMRHREKCIPRCAQHYSPSLDYLQCEYGNIVPRLDETWFVPKVVSTFVCLQSCLMEPHVNNGLSHSMCKGLPHGATCELQCPAGTRPSGVLVCERGGFAHQPLLPDRILFGVPRCYRSCDASKACGPQGSALQHGDTCKVVCPSGASPEISDVSCSDGEVMPGESPECLPGCPDPPVVAHATNLAECEGVTSGTVCSLRCETGYVKTNDPVCTRGSWSSAVCRAPCAPPVVQNANEGSYACEGYSQDSLVFHLGTCRPSCKAGFTAELPEGFSQLSCSDGVLTPSTFTCRGSCMTAPSIDYVDTGKLEECVGTAHGASCLLPCFQGYRKTKDLVCIDGTFSEEICIKECSDPPVVENAMQVFGCIDKPPGAICKIDCVEGYSAPPGKDEALCKDGRWSQVICDKECAAPSDIELAEEQTCREGSTVFSGGFCTPACLAGFQPSEARLSCLRGKLTPTTYSCFRSCGPVGRIENSIASKLDQCNGMDFDRVCPLTCEKGYKPSGDLICKLEGWVQHISFGLRGSEQLAISKGFKISDPISTTPEFVLTFGLVLLSPAGLNYQSILHVSSTGGGCCNDGDRVPGIFIAPTRVAESGRKLRVFMDGSDGCFDSLPELKLENQYLITVSVIKGILSVQIDDLLLCTVPAKERNYGTAEVYAGGPWDEPADAELRNVEYAQAGLPPTLARCDAAICTDMLPTVPGADESAVSGGNCIGLPYGSTCTDIKCPPGSRLAGHFECAGFGEWLPVPATGETAVRCVPLLCSETPPGTNMVCSERIVGAACPLICPDGFTSLGSFVCGPDGTWTSMEGRPPPSCDPQSCGEVPDIPNAVKPGVCNGLPSGTTCQGQCLPPWKPLFQYRCEASMWTEVPLCVPEVYSQATESEEATRAAVIFTVLLAPSVDLQDRTEDPQSWVDAATAAVELSTDAVVGDMVPSLTPLHARVIGSVISTDAAGRRVQSTATRLPGWRVQFMLSIVPSSDELSAGNEVASALPNIEPGVLEETLIQALPPFGRPRSLSTTLSQPHVASLHPDVAEMLSSTAGLVMASSSATTTLNPYILTTEMGQIAISTDVQEEAPEEQPEGFFTVPMLILISLAPLLCGLFYFFCRKGWRQARRHHDTVSGQDDLDFQYVVNGQKLNDDEEGEVPEETVKAYERKRALHRQSVALADTMLEGIQIAAAEELDAEKLDPSSVHAHYTLSQIGGKEPVDMQKSLEFLERHHGGHHHAPNGHPNGQNKAIENGNVAPEDEEEEAPEHEKVHKIHLTRKQQWQIARQAFCACLAEEKTTFLTWLCPPCLLSCCHRCCCCRRRKKEAPQTEPESSTPEDSSNQGSVQELQVEVMDAGEGAQVPDSLQSPQGSKGSPRSRLEDRHASPVTTARSGFARSVSGGSRSSRSLNSPAGESGTGSGSAHVPTEQELAQAEADARGITLEQLMAMKEIWDFQGADELLAPWNPVMSYHQAMKLERVDTSLAGKYLSDDHAGNRVVESVVKTTDEKRKLMIESHTLKLQAPGRARKLNKSTNQLAIKEGPPSEGSSASGSGSPPPELEDGEQVDADLARLRFLAEEIIEPVEEDQSDEESESGSDEAGGEKKDNEDGKQEGQLKVQAGPSGASKSLLTSEGGLMEQNSLNVMSVDDIPPVSVKQVRQAVEQARQRPLYQKAVAKVNREDVDEANDPKRRIHAMQLERAQKDLAESSGRAVNTCAMFSFV
eukprot:TRINITY_DN16635_c0_g1_i1.p1 TRINITY_DN16635_c0_g1~~TRINITY_DN16635_c0_g1_i1.p1  ORF type:complete len:2753 (+),score=429.40 TRINITY_DN16635_c0_g1_i1:119-8377(+)